MQTPAFYDQVRRLTVYDPLADFLGAASPCVPGIPLRGQVTATAAACIQRCRLKPTFLVWF